MLEIISRERPFCSICDLPFKPYKAATFIDLYNYFRDAENIRELLGMPYLDSPEERLVASVCKICYAKRYKEYAEEQDLLKEIKENKAQVKACIKKCKAKKKRAKK